MTDTKNNPAGDVHDRRLLRGPLWWRLLKKFVLVAIITAAVMVGLSMFAKPPTNLGVSDGQLAECPNSDNCVSSFAKRDSQYMDPINFWNENAPSTVEEIKEIVTNRFEEAKIISATNTYIHFEFTSKLFRFVDDVEFLVDEESKAVHFRSASRVGRSDIGVNRARMKKITMMLDPEKKFDE